MTPQYEAAGERALALAATRPAGSLRFPLSGNRGLADAGGPAANSRSCDGRMTENMECEE